MQVTEGTYFQTIVEYLAATFEVCRELRDLRPGGERKRGEEANVTTLVRKRSAIDVDGFARDAVWVSDQNDCLDSL